MNKNILLGLMLNLGLLDFSSGFIRELGKCPILRGTWINEILSYFIGCTPFTHPPKFSWIVALE
jgi:hypothetical protein